MKITVLQGEEKGRLLMENKDIHSLSEVKFNYEDYTLETLLSKGISGLAINDFLFDEEMFDGVVWKYAAVGKKNSDTINLNLSVEKTDDKQYKLISNKKDVLLIDFRDEIQPIGVDDIPDNNPTGYYEIAKLIYECIHRTRDYLEAFSKRIINNRETENQKKYRNEFFEKDIKNAINVDVALWTLQTEKTIKKERKKENLNEEETRKVNEKREQMIKENIWACNVKKWKRDNSFCDFSWQYLYFEHIMCAYHFLTNKQNRDVSKWKEDKDANVEFSNFRDFVDDLKEKINEIVNGNKEKEDREEPYNSIKKYCSDINNYRNKSSHNIGETMEQKTRIMKALLSMQRIVEMLGGKNHGLCKKLKEINKEINTKLDNINE